VDQSQEITGCTSHRHLSMHLTIAGWRASLGIPLELRSPDWFPCEVRVPGGRISVKRQAVSGKMECARLILAYPVGEPSFPAPTAASAACCPCRAPEAAFGKHSLRRDWIGKDKSSSTQLFRARRLLTVENRPSHSLTEFRPYRHLCGV
jgi:hypothetical protein